MPISNAQRQSAHRERQAAKMAAIDTLYAAITAAARRGHQLSVAVLDDDVAATISNLTERISQEAAEPTAPQPQFIDMLRHSSGEIVFRRVETNGNSA